MVETRDSFEARMPRSIAKMCVDHHAARAIVRIVDAKHSLSSLSESALMRNQKGDWTGPALAEMLANG